MGFLERPQTVWWRKKALFQIHLWTGVIAALYVIAVSVSGSALVFYREIEDWTAPPIAPSSKPIDYDFLVRSAEKAYPGWWVASITPPENLASPSRFSVTNGKQQYISRFQNPHTGEDLGPIGLQGPLEFLQELHVELLAGDTGHVVNGAGGICLFVMTLTGIILWWPGIRNWRRSLAVKWSAGWKRINWDLHSAVGFWLLAFTLTWAVTGTYFVFPDPFHKALDVQERELPSPPEAVPGRPFAPLNALIAAAEQATPGAATTWVQVPRGKDTRVRIIRHEIYEPRAGHHPSAYVNAYTAEVDGLDISYDKPVDKVLRWASYLHYGNFGGPFWKSIWVVLGLAPALLAVTGGLMWWNRSLSKSFNRRWRKPHQPVKLQERIG